MITSAERSIGTLQNFLSRKFLDGSLLSYLVEVLNSVSWVEASVSREIIELMGIVWKCREGIEQIQDL